MERPKDCECHNAACNEIAGARLRFVKNVYGFIEQAEVLPTTIRECPIRRELGRVAGGLTIRLAE